MAWEVQWRNGVWLPAVGWWLDARAPVRRSFVSHAHFDHLAAHDEIVCSPPTARLLAARLPGHGALRVLPFGEPHELPPGLRVTLHPAGHIFGSAQWLAETADGTLLYTGDFKLRRGLSAEPCATPRADVLVMETTYGRPHYVLPPTARVLEEIVRFCHEALLDGETPVLLGYSLGKSQELLRGLAAAGLPVMLHPQTMRLTKVYEELGVAFPPHRPFVAEEVAGHVVIAPPQGGQSPWLRRLARRRTAVITGWAMDPGAAFRHQCDAAFPLSDHADYADLMAFVETVQPRRVYTLHGFAAEFARDLRARGIEAWALGEVNQLDLPLDEPPTLRPAPAPITAATAPAAGPGALGRLAATGDAVRAASGKLEKVALVADYLRSLDDDDLAHAAVFLAGRPLPQSDGRPLQVGWAALKQAVLAVAGLTEVDYRATYARTADSSETAEVLLAGRTRPAGRTLAHLAALFGALAAAGSAHGRAQLLEEELQRLAPAEARYLVKIVTGDLRIGLREGLVEEAVAAATGADPEAIRAAHLRCGDLGRVAVAARHGALDAIGLTLFHPLQFMLASPAADADAIVERFGECVWIEPKFDGIRCQLHKAGDRVELFSRDLRRITAQFPDLAAAAAALPGDVILDGELLAWRGERALPFAELQRRLGRRGDDLFLGAEIPVSFTAYDLLWADGRAWLGEALRERRRRLERLVAAVASGSLVRLAPQREVFGADALELAFNVARESGHEGLMAKDPASLYQPGRRGFAWLKLKRPGATLDVVVVAVEYGHGKRRDVLSDYTFAVRDDETDGRLLTVGKAYSGLTDAEIAALTPHFLEHTLEVRGRVRHVVPDTVIEVAFDSIRPSTRHESGFALRFPRIVRLRPDRTPRDIDTLATCRRLAEGTAARENHRTPGPD